MRPVSSAAYWREGAAWAFAEGLNARRLYIKNGKFQRKAADFFTRLSGLMADLGEDVFGECFPVGQIGIVGMVDGPLRFFGPSLVLQHFH